MGLTLAAADREYHRVNRATLIVDRSTSPAARFGAPAKIVLPAGAGVAERAVDVHLHDVVAWAIDEVHRELYGVGLGTIEAAGDHCFDEGVLGTAAHHCSSRTSIRPIWRLVLVVV